MDAHHQQGHPVWKVSHKLDQLDMLAEQHQHQTEHHDGLPDWPSHPNEPAGVASKTHVHVPANFAWSNECSSSSSNGSLDSGVAHTLQQKQTQVLPVCPTTVLSLPPTPSSSHAAGKRHFSHAGDETPQSQRGAYEAEAQLLSARPTTPLQPPPAAVMAGKRHFGRTGGETPAALQGERGATKRHYDSTPGDGHEAAARIEELRQETHKFLNKLAYQGPSSSSSAGGGYGAANSSGGLATGVSFQEPSPVLVNSAPVLVSEVPEQRRTGKPGTDRHWDSQYARSRGSVPPPARATPSFALPTVSSKRFAPQPQTSIFSMTAETQKPKSELLNKQPAAVNLRYRTTYSDANAWIHPDATLQTAADDLKARQVLDAAAGSGTNCERRYVLSASSALRVAKESARQFLGEHLHVNPVKAGASSNALGSSAEAATRASSAAQEGYPLNLRATRDEAIQTELEPCARVLQPSELESSGQTDANVSIFPSAAAAVMSVASNETTRKASAARKELNRSISRVDYKPERSFGKTQPVLEKPKTPAVKISSHLQSTANPLLMYPRYPPEPMAFRAKSTYMTEFGRAAVKKRIFAR